MQVGKVDSPENSPADRLASVAQMITAALNGVVYAAAHRRLAEFAKNLEANYPTLAEAAGLILSRLEKRATRTGALFCINQGIPMFVRAGTYETGAYSVGRYEPFTLELFKSFINPGSRVLDLGAQFGIFTISAARRAPGGEVIAFEPEPSNFSLLNLNLRLNRVASRTQTFPFAVGEGESEVDFYVYRDSDSHAIHRHPEAEIREVIKLRVVSIDDFLDAPRLDVVKMDIEGHEPFALEGMRKTLDNSDSVVLFCELAPEYLRRAGVDPADYLLQLESLGFGMRVIDERRRLLRKVDPEFLRSGHPGRAVNLLCRRRNA